MPYLSPLAPFKINELTDTIVRRPWFMTFIRPSMKGSENEVRQDTIHSPHK